MTEEKSEKRCSGCKTTKTLENFYKNKLVLDGHSNYCIDCTRENSRKYFQRKKEKQQPQNKIKREKKTRRKTRRKKKRNQRKRRCLKVSK